MVLYVAIDFRNKKVLCVSSHEAAIKSHQIASSEEYVVLSTSNVILGNAAQAEVSMSYEESCVQESVRTALREKGVDENTNPVEFEKLAADIASDAYHDMLHYDVDEEYAIDEAIKKHDDKILALHAEEE